MREVWRKGLLVAGIGLAMVMPQGCRRPGPSPPQTEGATTVNAPAPRFVPRPSEDPWVDPEQDAGRSGNGGSSSE